jgi:hypothetical protein
MLGLPVRGILNRYGAQEAVAEKPFADLDAVWGKGIINSDQFVQVVYLVL